MRTVAIVNQKGGCGKTTTAVNLAAVLAKRGVRTLLVDLDPQCHCAVALGVPETGIARSVADALVEDLDEDALEEIVWQLGPTLRLVPSSTMLAALEAPGGGLHERPDRDRRLARLLARLAPGHDVCLVDCPPTIGLLTFNALRAADDVLVPVETGYFALKGAEKQVETIDRVAKRLERPIDWTLLPTLHRAEVEASRDILAALRKRFGDRVLEAVIREDPALREAAALGRPVCEHRPDAPSRRDYEEVADAMLERARDAGGRPVATEAAGRDGGHPGVIEIEVPEGVSVPGAPRMPATTGPGGNETDRTRTESTASPGTGRVGRAAELADRLRALAARMHGGDDRDATGDSPASEPAFGTAVEASPRTPAAMADRPAAAPDAGSEAASAAATATVPDPAVPLRIAEPPVAPVRSPIDEKKHEKKVAGVLGATPTSRGVLFVQPSAAGRRIAVAGTFNGWSPAAHVLEHSPEVGVHQLLVPLPSGRHRYRLVIDGHWCEDPHGQEKEHAPSGERLDVVEVAGSVFEAPG